MVTSFREMIFCVNILCEPVLCVIKSCERSISLTLNDRCMCVCCNLIPQFAWPFGTWLYFFVINFWYNCVKHYDAWYLLMRDFSFCVIVLCERHDHVWFLGNLLVWDFVSCCDFASSFFVIILCEFVRFFCDLISSNCFVLYRNSSHIFWMICVWHDCVWFLCVKHCLVWSFRVIVSCVRHDWVFISCDRLVRDMISWWLFVIFLWGFLFCMRNHFERIFWT